MSAYNQTELNCVEWPNLVKFSQLYAKLHGYLALIVCVFGSVTNILNAIILTQRSMRNPTNVILTGVASGDLVTMIAYGIYAVYLNVLTAPSPDEYTHSLAMVRVILITQGLILGSHTFSTVLLVVLAVLRCRIMYVVTLGRGSKSHGKTGVQPNAQKRIVLVGFAVGIVLGLTVGIPVHFIYEIELRPHNQTSQMNVTHSLMSYWFDIRPGADGLEHGHFVLNGVFVKILASVLIFVLTSFLLVTMRIAEKHYQELQMLSGKKPAKLVQAERANTEDLTKTRVGTNTNSEVVPSMRISCSNTSNEKPSMLRLINKTRQTQRATVMLIILVISFVVTEAPQGVVNTLVAIKGDCFHNNVYVPLGDILDLLVLMNSSVNFILYCAMSQMFRVHFRHLIAKCCCPSMCVEARGQRDLTNRPPSAWATTNMPMHVETCYQHTWMRSKKVISNTPVILLNAPASSDGIVHDKTDERVRT
ncbi:hypothetical protein T265_09081 [Opisthorchis viverrini]|uniref:G-protein coupled receptors family 1 profile domain-containing protein n=1 Tax=Opisthorchis viverrini TaxID=6198 RepID=A0A075A640_OPIVI|nr:hypothetical protein T265_09081 [Opisthorchis viverrini]KER22909.1 hypothetical protein T265_09081 [Opisthorchis viverrini]